MGSDGGLVGRADALRQVRDALPGGSLFVRGEPGMGKTALLRAAVDDVGGHLAWGTCIEGGGPGFWPWTQALTALVRAVGVEAATRVAGPDRALLAALVPALGPGQGSAQTDRDRLLLLDATVSWLHALAEEQPVVLVLDDLQWADSSSLALLEQIVARPRRGPLALLGAYRTGAEVAGLDRAVALGEHLALSGLDRAAVAELVRKVTGTEPSDDVVDRVHARAGGHPLFTRELLLADGEGVLPAAVRQAVARRVGALSPVTQDVLTTAALVGNDVLPDVLADVHGDRAPVDLALDEAGRAGLVQRAEGWRFAHDVFREAVVDDVSGAERASRHAAIATALDARAARGGTVSAADVAWHHRAALPDGDLAGAVDWALRAADEDTRGLALDEAVAHLRRLRAAAAEAGLALPDGLLCDVLLVEGDLLARTGRLPDARGLVRAARDAAQRAGDASRVGRAALAAAALGARFGVRRDELVEELEGALSALGTDDPALAAHLTAVLARELVHSVPEQRARSGPLTEQALELARGCEDPAVLRACLLARHDVLWSPGNGAARAAVTEELVSLARRRADLESLVEALVLQANALLESGSAGFGPALHEALSLLSGLDEPKHRYTLLTRQACLALLRRDLDEAQVLIDEAAALGERLREPDTRNVQMSQQCELVRARNQPDELRAFAAAAVAHWTGAPVHAHAVAAGFSARAGDLDATRHHVSVVLAKGTWRADRSYLWSVLVRELAAAAIALGDRGLCEELLEDVLPLRGSCGVNGAAVAFAGCHSRTAGELMLALGDPAGEDLLREAADVEARLGVGEPSVRSSAALRRRGPVWEVCWHGSSATVAHSKGMLDLAVLLRRPREDVHVLDLVQASVLASDTGAALDRSAAEGYRTRLQQLAAERESAERAGDDDRVRAVDDETAALATELGRGTGLAGRVRPLGSSTSERARKAVTARVRDAVKRIQEELPAMGDHLDREVVTGLRCRYTGDEQWTVEA